MAQITAGDVRSVLERWKIADGAVKEVRREEKDNRTFTGGLAEGLNSIGEMGEEDVEDGGVAVSVGGWSMTLPLLDSARQLEAQSGRFVTGDVRYTERGL